MSNSINNIYKPLGYIITICSIFFGIGYIVNNFDKVKFHLLNDRSMCLCGPDITQAGTKGDLFLISLVAVIGIIIIIKH